MPKAVKVARCVRFAVEEGVVGRVGAGIAALDVIEPEPVEHRRDRDLVVERKIDARGLRPVAQRGVEEIEAFPGHDATPATPTGQVAATP